MTLWLVFALMTAAAIFAVLWPLARRKPLRRGSDVAVYRDQLDEIQRDRSAGLIGEAEAEAARVEVSRRLIAAADAAESEKPAPETLVALAPPRHRHRRACPAAGRRRRALSHARLAGPAGRTAGGAGASAERGPHEIQNMVAKVEDHVARNPKDGRAWEVLAPVYMRLGRFDDAVRAFRNVLSLNGSNAAHEADLGEAHGFRRQRRRHRRGQDANSIARWRSTAQDVMARFYLGMAADQDGRRAEAEKIWRDLLAEAPPGAPWVEMVTPRLEPDGAGRYRGCRTAGAGAAAAPPDHDVNAMVERLADAAEKGRLRRAGLAATGALLPRARPERQDAGRHRRRPQGAGQRCRQAAPVRRRHSKRPSRRRLAGAAAAAPTDRSPAASRRAARATTTSTPWWSASPTG